MTEIEKYLQDIKKTASMFLRKANPDNEMRNYLDLIVSKLTLLENIIMSQSERLQEMLGEVRATKGLNQSVLLLQKKVFAELRKMNAQPGGITDAQLDELETALAENVAVVNESVLALQEVDAENPDEPVAEPVAETVSGAEGSDTLSAA
jgi:hypothetical protein